MAIQTGYTRVINAVLGVNQRFMCQFCGISTPTAGDSGVCGNCENIISSTREDLAAHNRDLVNQLDSFNDLLSNNNYEEATKAYEVIMGKYNLAPYYYVGGLNYIKYSNYEISNIRYDLEGFMEANAVHRQNASEHFSHAKLLLNKCVSVGKKTMSSSQGNEFSTNYIMLLSYIKLGNLRAAESTLKNLEVDKYNYLFSYAKVVLDVALGEYRDAIRNANLMMDSGTFPLALVYYLAFSFFKTKNYTDAEKLSTSLNENMPNANIQSLLAELKKVS